MRSIDENGGSRVTSCLAKTHRSRTSRRILVAAVRPREERLQALGRHVALDARRVPTRARLLDDGQAHVGAEDLDGNLAAVVAQELEQADGDGVDLLARRAAGNPNADGRVAGAILAELREHEGAQRLERLGLAEEARHVDEHLLAERGGLAGIAPEQLEISGQVAQAAQQEAPLQTSAQGGVLVAREVDAARLAHHQEDLLVVRVLASLGRGPGERWSVPADAHNLPGQPRRGQDDVDAPGGDRALRHAAVLRRGVLGERDPALALDDLDAFGPVEAAAAEHDAHGQAVAIQGERLEEAVDGQVHAPDLDARPDLKRAPADEQPCVGRQAVDVVDLDRDSVGRGGDGHGGGAAEDLDQATLVMGIEVMDDDQRDAGVGPQLPQQLGRGRESAGRCADPHDRKGGRRPGGRAGGIGAGRAFVHLETGLGAGGVHCKPCRPGRRHLRPPRRARGITPRPGPSRRRPPGPCRAQERR